MAVEIVHQLAAVFDSAIAEIAIFLVHAMVLHFGGAARVGVPTPAIASGGYWQLVVAGNLDRRCRRLSIGQI